MTSDNIPIAFCYQRNKQKALACLLGILNGITAEQRLNDTEILFLATWLSSDSEFKTDGDFLDIQDQIHEVLEDGIITADEKEELLELLNDVLQYNKFEDSNMAMLVNMLLGFLQGISADDQLTEQEIMALLELLVRYPELCTSWPGSLLVSRLRTILADGVITEEECDELLTLVKQVSGQSFTDSGLAAGLATTFFANDFVPSLEGRTVCFTGTFLSGTRRVLEQQAAAFGASAVKDVSKKVSVLVIGSLASRDWMFTSHGRKIEAAIRAKSKGQEIHIINEELWGQLVSG